MKRNRFNIPASQWSTMAVAVLMLAGMVGCAAAPARAQMETRSVPDLSIGTAQFPNDDAIILRWEQHWTLDTDGTVHQREHYWVKLLNDRPISRYGDPRIPFVNGKQELIIHKAQTTMADGTVQAVPDYSFNIAAPDDIAGWPEYADWHDQIVSFGGIEPNCVLELDYEIVTPPGVFPWIDGDLRLDDEYPVVERAVYVTVPSAVTLHHWLERAPTVRSAKRDTTTDGGPATVYHWTVGGLAGARGEAQAVPWRQRCPRLRFTTCPDAASWGSTIIQRIDRAAQPNESIKEFAEAAVEEERDPAERVRKVAKKLHDSFNFVTSSKALWGLPCRKASDILRANYGNPLESAALLLAAVRSLGLEASAVVGVDATAWDASDEVAPTASAFAGAVVEVDLPDGPMHVHPQLGEFKNPGHWGRHWLLSTDAGGKLEKTYVYARGEQKPSELEVVGKITVDKEGKATGELRIELTGGFYDPCNLDTADAQKALVAGMVSRLLSDLEVPSHAVVALSQDVFKATADVASSGALKSFNGKHGLKFGDGPAFLHEFPLPLDRSRRTTAVHVPGRVREKVDLIVEMPEEWKASTVPASTAAVEGPWGRLVQKVELDGRTLRLHRAIAITSETISPSDFATLRDTLNNLRATRSLMFAFGK